MISETPLFSFFPLQSGLSLPRTVIPLLLLLSLWSFLSIFHPCLGPGVGLMHMDDGDGFETSPHG